MSQREPMTETTSLAATEEQMHALLALLVEALHEELSHEAVKPAILRCAVNLLKSQRQTLQGTDVGSVRRGLSRLRAKTLGSQS